MARVDRLLCLSAAVLGLACLLVGIASGKSWQVLVGAVCLVAGFSVAPLALRR